MRFAYFIVFLTLFCMYKTITLFVTAGLAAVTLANAQLTEIDWSRPAHITRAAEVSPKKALPKKIVGGDELYDYRVLMTEDFSKMTEGSVGAPGSEYLDAEDHSIPDKYFSTPGWAGYRVKQAGGAVYIETRDESEDEEMHFPQGELMTSEIEINTNGVHDVTICARVKSEVPDNELLVIPLAHAYSGAFGIMTGEEITEEWSDVEITVELPEAFSDWNDEGEQVLVPITTCVFKLGGSVGPIYIDEISLVDKAPKVAIPQNLGYKNFSDDGFTAVWDAVEGADKYILNVNTLKLVDGEYVPTPFIEQKEVTGTSYDIAVPTQGALSFTVEAVKGDLRSPVSDVFKVFDVMPPVMKEAENITESDFTARWDAAKGAAGYEVWAYKGFKADADVDGYVLAKLDFSGMTEPGEDFEGDEVMWLDEYAPGWSACCYPEPVAGGLKMDNSAAMYGQQSRFQSCEYDLSNAGGKVNVSITACSEAGMTILAALGGADETGTFETLDYKEITLTPEMKTYTVTLEGGVAQSLVGIYMVDYNDMIVADITVTQDLKAGESIYTPYAYDYVEGETSVDLQFPEGEFTNVKCAARSFKYEYMEFFGMQFVMDQAVSAFSAPIFVEKSSGVHEIGVDNPDTEAVYYDLQGRKCPADNLVPGIYIRKADGKAEKILVK